MNDREDDYLQLKGETKEGWCSLQYCEIEWMESYQDDVRFFSLF